MSKVYIVSANHVSPTYRLDKVRFAVDSHDETGRVVNATLCLAESDDWQTVLTAINDDDLTTLQFAGETIGESDLIPIPPEPTQAEKQIAAVVARRGESPYAFTAERCESEFQGHDNDGSDVCLRCSCDLNA